MPASPKVATTPSKSSLLATIIFTQHARYWLITTWAVALSTVIGFAGAAMWWTATIGWAGWLRSQFELWAAKRGGKAFEAFPLVGMTSAIFWAAGPMLAWTSDSSFGRPLAMLMLAIGYQLTVTQVGREPFKAVIITLPYTAVVAFIASQLWNTPALATYLTGLTVLYGGLSFSLYYGWAAQQKIKEHQDDQAGLIHEREIERDKAQAADRIKSSFLAMVSHELRTPMNGVLGAAQLLERDSLTPSQKQLVGIVRASGDSLLTLLNDLLDLTKVEADRMELEAVETDLPALVDTAAQVWRLRADEKDLDYRIEWDGAPRRVLADPTRLTQILHNLLSNAVKFTRHGGVSLKIGTETGEAGATLVSFTVTDTGKGIRPEDQERLFEAFTQADNSITREYGGTGLGLAISRRLARLMGGDLTLESVIGEGSIFRLCVPLDVIDWQGGDHADTGPADARIEEARALDILIVEDHPVNRIVLETFLTSAGHRSICAENGAIALEIAAAQPFDLVLMDVNMPVMDGLAATRAIRTNAGPNQATPVIVLSASARPEDHQAGHDAGADGYLNKPVDFGALGALLHQCGNAPVESEPLALSA